ncbi:MAG: hypothetical protein HFACDABA_01990 [Anaerolineales bacterium]|nr:hypothetical protein [Anaerolineales bacterium]
MKTLAAETLQNMTYVYDSVGNISSISDSVNSLTQFFGYDALDRLTSASASGTPAQGAYSETYRYDPVTGNLKIKGDMTLDYLDSSHVHAVTNANSNTYSYDPNGNQITRNIGSDTFNLYYDAENRLVEVKKNSVTIAQFTFDGDGKRVKSMMDGETILFVGGHYEKQGTDVTKYYFAGTQRIAVRKSGTLSFLLSDHLGSTSITTDANGNRVSETRYKAWGEVRFTEGVLPTKYSFTGQYSHVEDFGLMHYGARWLDNTTGRFIQADSIVPNIAQGYDRYAYVDNAPTKYIDPSGHSPKHACNYLKNYNCEAPDETLVIGDDVTELLFSMFGPEVEYLFENESCKNSTISVSYCAGSLLGSHLRLFGNGGRYDIKIKMNMEFGGDVTLCGPLFCQKVDYSTPGNILFGFLSAARGMPQGVSWLAGGILENYDSLKKEMKVHPEYAGSLFDNPGDKAAVDFGYWLFKTYGAAITMKEFRDALTTRLDSFQPSSAPQPGYMSWPIISPQLAPTAYPYGYFLNP